MGILPIILAVVGISILVIVHESGHYLAARAFGMRVLRYSIGFGPTLFKYKPKNSPTTFLIGAIPFLAYVQIAGMNPHEEVDADDPEIYPNKGLFARMVTIMAGPVANYLAASVMVFGLALNGFPDSRAKEPMTIGHVEEGTPAADAGLRKGDVIVEAAGEPVRDIEDLKEVTAPRPGQETVYIVKRDGHRLPPLTVTPENRDGTGFIGVGAEMERIYTPMSVGEAAGAAVMFPFELTMAQLEGLGHLFQERTTEGLTGPVGMGKIVAEQVSRGPAEYVLILVVLSVALGMFNLLPFPALDGGRLTFLGYELITRKKPNERFEATVHAVGLLFLLGVLVLVTFRDVAG
ncbi:MAG: M50 family metallopeptidase [Myxococcota bacterium]